MSFPNQFGGRHRLAEPCGCAVSDLDEAAPGAETRFHLDLQDETTDAWHSLTELIVETAASNATVFNPAQTLGPERWRTIVRLPASIRTLTRVTDLNLYGSNLRSLPPEIGQMIAVRRFEPYTSYRLHWFPYEITRCKNLVDSTVSTRALYGNRKYRPPFPQLPLDLPPDCVPPVCSVCQGPFAPTGPEQRWISLLVATDVLPLLVHACSSECVNALPHPPHGYLEYPHEGGTELVQPEPL